MPESSEEAGREAALGILGGGDEMIADRWQWFDGCSMTEYIAWMEEGMWQHSRMGMRVCANVQCLSVVPRAKETNL